MTFGLGTTCAAATSDEATAAAPTTARRPITHGPMTQARSAIHAPFSTQSGCAEESGQTSTADCDSTTLLPIVIEPRPYIRTSSPIQQFAPTTRFHGAEIRTRCRITTPGPMVAPKSRRTARRSGVGTKTKPMVVEASGQLSAMR